MDELLVGWIGLGIFTLLVVLGMRIAFAAASIGILGIAVLKGWNTALYTAGYLPHGIVAHYSLSVIPLFILMGYFGYHAGLISQIFSVGRKWFGHTRGGLAVATTYGSAAFGACTGSSVAAAAVMGKMAIPEMLKSGYDRKLAAATVAAGGTLSVLIPPSVPMVIYGIITENSIGRLLMSGIIPGVLSAILYAFVIKFLVYYKPGIAPILPKESWKSRFIALKDIWGVMFIFFTIFGGIYSGIFTPTEAGGAGASIALIIGLVTRRLRWKEIKDSLLETGQAAVMIFTIVVGVLIFIRFLALSGLPDAFSRAVVSMGVSRYLILAGIIVLFLFLGMFMDLIGMMLLGLPIVYPIATGLGFDPIWFGVLVVKLGEMCLLTPPVGLNIYVVNSVAPDIHIEDIFRGIVPFILMDLVLLIILILFPKIATFIPSLMNR